LLEEFFKVDATVAKSSLQREAVNFIMKGKDQLASILVCHFDVATLAMNLDEA
jgi:hypothetical protein